MRRDGSDEPEPETSLRARMMRARTMREMLLDVGIELQAPITPKPSRAAAPAIATAPNRGAIRRVLIAGGVPEKDLRWMTMSCPSLERAVESYPPLPPASEPAPEPEHVEDGGDPDPDESNQWDNPGQGYDE